LNFPLPWQSELRDRKCQLPCSRGSDGKSLPSSLRTFASAARQGSQQATKKEVKQKSFSVGMIAK